jgi:hypothetical protein
MTDNLNPIIAQLHAAETDRDVGQLLLMMPDSIALKFHSAVEGVCRRRQFELGELFIQARVHCLLAVRGPDGVLPGNTAQDMENFRRVMANFVSAPRKALADALAASPTDL